MAHKMPTGLGAAGRRLWKRMTEELTLDRRELAVLEHACRLEDQAARLEATLADADTIVRGSAGQPVSHPGFTELRMTRQAVTRELARLDLPADEHDERAVESQMRSRMARSAARARWGA